MKKLIKEAITYILIGLIIWGIVFLISQSKGLEIGKIVYNTFAQTIEIILSVAIFIGLITAWLTPEQIAKFFGKEAGWKRFLIASSIPMFLGGSLFTIFPLLGTLIDNGISYGVAISFITAWSAKIPMIPLEIHFLGINFTIIRTLLVIPMAFILGYISEIILEKIEKRKFKLTPEEIAKEELVLEEDITQIQEINNNDK
jgi:uncharacterized membrane protein YraQ (UPF0718 family)